MPYHGRSEDPLPPLVVIALVLLLHGALGWLLLRASRGIEVPPSRQRIELLLIDDRTSVAPPLSPPPPRSARRRPSAAPDPALARSAAPDAPTDQPIPAAAATVLLPDGSRALLRDAAAHARRTAPPLRPGHGSARLPGRELAYADGFHVREERSPQDIVQAIGRFIGGGYSPCPDLRSRLRSARDAAERDGLLDRIARRCR